MFSLRAYQRCSTVEQVLEALNSQESCVILAGNHWLRQGSRVFDKGLDLSSIPEYTKIERLEDGSLYLGAGLSYGQIEDHELLAQFYGAVLPRALKGIVGRQLRNTAGLGASVYSRFAFSDALPVLLATQARVKLAQAGELSFIDFLALPASALKKDFMVALILPKEGFSAQAKGAYKALRLTANDFPLLTCAISYEPDCELRLCVGARPGIARYAQKASQELSELLKEKQDKPQDFLAQIKEEAYMKALLESMQEDMSFGSAQAAPKEFRLSVLERFIPEMLEELIGEGLDA